MNCSDREQAALLREQHKIEELIQLFAQIASEQRWQPSDQLRAHAARSIYFAVSVGGILAGGLQLELPDGSGAWSFQAVWPEMKPACNAVAAYVSMFAIAEPFRGDRLLFWLPCVEMWRFCRERGIEDLWLAATPSTLTAYWRMGWPLEVRSELRVHWGEECFLTGMTVDAVEASIVAKAARSETYRAIVERGYGKEALERLMANER